MNKKRIVRKIKSYSPVVKKSSHVRLKEHALNLERQTNSDKETIQNLKLRAEDWAMEVRALRLEIQRLKEYNKWFADNFPSTHKVANQREHSSNFTYRPLVSIILPVYNTKPAHLAECIESVIQQSYSNWQLCVVDDASTHKETLECLKNYQEKDPRIVIKHQTINGHISAASNAAIEMAEGEFIALLDHDDILWPNALFENVKLLQTHKKADFIYSDEDKIDADGTLHFAPYFKPGWSPHLLECINYVTHFSLMRTSLVKKVGGFNSKFVGAQDWDLFLRLSEHTSEIYHIPTILYSWRAHEHSTAMHGQAKGYVVSSQKTVLENHFKRTKNKFKIELDNNIKGDFWYPKYSVIGKPLVSIIIPTKDKADYLKRCVTSILDKTTYTNYEIVIVDTGSKEAETKKYYENIKKNISHKKLVIKGWRHKLFNYSDACNFGAKYAKGEYLVMLNNDTEVITETWVEDMLGYAQQKDIGAVGVKLLYPSMQIQHAGVTVGIGSFEPVAGHIGINTDYSTDDFLTNMYINTVRDTSAVTAACMMVSTKKFWQVKGFDPTFRVTFNDVDLCLKFRKANYLNIYLPYVTLIHDESISIGRVNQQERDMVELTKSAKLMRKRWATVIDNDPYYNKNFYILSSNFGLDVHPN